MKPKCILFAGAPGSSKTPVAIYLSWNTDLPVFNNDAIRREVAEDTLNMLRSQDPEFIKRQRERIEKVLKSKKSFIFDRSVDRSWQDTKELISKYGYDYFLISFNLSEDFIRTLGRAKGYPDNEENKIWFKQHMEFVSQYSDEIDLVIDDENFGKRMSVALSSVKKFLEQ